MSADRNTSLSSVPLIRPVLEICKASDMSRRDRSTYHNSCIFNRVCFRYTSTAFLNAAFRVGNVTAENGANDGDRRHAGKTHQHCSLERRLHGRSSRRINKVAGLINFMNE